MTLPPSLRPQHLFCPLLTCHQPTHTDTPIPCTIVPLFHCTIAIANSQEDLLFGGPLGKASMPSPKKKNAKNWMTVTTACGSNAFGQANLADYELMAPSINAGNSLPAEEDGSVRLVCHVPYFPALPPSLSRSLARPLTFPLTLPAHPACRPACTSTQTPPR